MSIMRCILNGNAIRTLHDLYDQLSAQLPLPAHFGRNLDALWDVLSTDIPGPFEVVWQHADASKKALGKDFEHALKVFHELLEERADFTLKIEP